MNFDHKPHRGDKLQPLDEISGYKVRPGFYDRNGAAQAANGVSFTIHSMGATGCTLLLFRPKEQEPFAKIRYPETYCIGSTYSMLVFGLNIEEFEYAFQLDGPYDEKKGLRFHKDNILLDPYARAVTGQRHWGERPEGGKDFVYHARVVENNFDWEKSCFLNHPFEDLVIYEMHVRGFTRDASSGVKAPGTFEGLREKIPYLKDLGINAVELMPVFEFDEMEDTRVVDGERLYNYWGYNTVCFFAPNTSYTSVVEHNHEGDELKNLIYELKENGIEVILDVVFNHTAEGNEKGPCFSFKGIDNNIYYMLTPDGYYYNFSGCGNVMNCNHPIVRKFIIDCLRYWVINYRVDGFRFDLASILSRDQNGAPMENPPILQGLACDPILAKAKLIAEAWGAGGFLCAERCTGAHVSVDGRIDWTSKGGIAMQLWKNTALTSVAALLGLFLLPLAVAREPAEVPEYTELPRTEQTAPVQPAVKAVYDADRTLRVLDGETVREMTLADYLVGVTAAEMPASFAEEALKAQAVAARTYTLYKLTAGRTPY